MMIRQEFEKKYKQIMCCDENMAIDYGFIAKKYIGTKINTDFTLIELIHRIENMEQLNENEIGKIEYKTPSFYDIDQWYMNSLNKNSAYYHMFNKENIHEYN